jgi:multisubunit Na+/H+ antiporter MnhB subunit
MMTKVARQLSAGMKEGFRTRNGAFLGILAIAIAIPVLLLAFTAREFNQSFSWGLIVEIGLPFWVSVALSLYMMAIKAMQVFQHQQGNKEALPKLSRQFDIVVFVLLIGLIASLTL